MIRDEETLLRWYLSRLHPDSGFQDRTNTVFDEWYQFRSSWMQGGTTWVIRATSSPGHGGTRSSWPTATLTPSRWTER